MHEGLCIHVGMHRRLQTRQSDEEGISLTVHGSANLQHELCRISEALESKYLRLERAI